MRSDVRVLLAPRLLPLHLLGLVATVAAVALGLWQLEAWQAQRAAEARDLSAKPPVALEQVLGADQPFPSAVVGRPVAVRGQWLPDSTFYVSGREYAGRAGVWAVTPVAVCEPAEACSAAPALLVVRGWSADPAAAPAPPQGRVRLTGWLQPPEGSGRPDRDPDDDVLPDVRIADAIQRVDQDLYSAYVIAQEATPALDASGLEPVTPESLPDPGAGTGLRNLLYALEWWIFGAFALFVWLRWARDEVERERAGTAPRAAAGPAAPDPGASEG